MYGNVNVYFLLPINYEQPTWNEEWLLTTYGCGYQLFLMGNIWLYAREEGLVTDDG